MLPAAIGCRQAPTPSCRVQTRRRNQLCYSSTATDVADCRVRSYESWLRDPAAIRAVQDVVRKHTRLSTCFLVPEVVMWLLPLESQGEGILPLWQELEDVAGHMLGPPYWAVPWPGGQALARHILDNPGLVEGQRVLDLGSGCAVEALAAASVGARAAVAADIDPIAALVVDMNAAANGVQAQVQALVADAADVQLDGSWEVVLAGDVCFQRDVAEVMLPKLQQHAHTGGVALLGDPSQGRPFSPGSSSSASLAGVRASMRAVAEYRVKTHSSDLIEGASEKMATVWCMDAGSLPCAL